MKSGDDERTSSSRTDPPPPLEVADPAVRTLPAPAPAREAQKGRMGGEERGGCLALIQVGDSDGPHLQETQKREGGRDGDGRLGLKLRESGGGMVVTVAGVGNECRSSGRAERRKQGGILWR